MTPDWRDARTYPHLDSGIASVGFTWLAWEFLRRNGDYQSDWTRFAASASRNDKANIAAGIAKRWGLRHPTNPAAGSLNVTWKYTSAAVYSPGPGFASLTPKEQDATGKRSIMFDVSMPLAPQIATETNALREHAEYWRSEHPHPAPAATRAGKMNFDTFVEMLRILDADTEGAKPADVIAALWPEEPNGYPDFPLRKRLITRRRTARTYRDGKYRGLLTFGTYPRHPEN